MAGMGAGYDLSVATISPDGRVFQVEYATKAVDNAGAALGLVCKDGIALGVEKSRLHKMLVPGTCRRLMAVDKHVGIAVTGLISDGRQIVKRARSEAESFRKTYGEPIPPQILAERIGLFVHTFTLYWSVRPFGASVLIAGLGSEGISTSGELYCVEPSGTAYKYFGMAIGKGKQLAKTELEKLNLSEMSCHDALFHLDRIIRQIHDETKDKNLEIELSMISPESNLLYQLVPQKTFEEADARAIEYLQALEEE
ncbi:peptidase, T1 family protein [Cardiosporidium cionae]|uniref:Peptidase, T1 family protein n=1 Tax=Cardiosporidium cionae TaxID=476202 RepID=A0ABQ7J8B7_9APIC|nr:peptidase, T1 family protein [Cardiosporidium cionae]|eukprot:KAF8820235.1 peptidase, T1 family protein [Cardiosporidium cionae]